LSIGFAGGTYEHLFYVADVEARGAVMNGDIHVALDRTDFLAVFPLKEVNRARLVGTVRDESEATARGDDRSCVYRRREFERARARGANACRPDSAVPTRGAPGFPPRRVSNNFANLDQLSRQPVE
jgi:hypothetical protein